MAHKRRRFAQRRRACGYGQEAFAEAVKVDRTTVTRWESGETEPQPWHRGMIATVLEVTLEGLDGLLTDTSEADTDPGRGQRDDPALVNIDMVPDDEMDAMELARRVAASDVGDETLLRLEQMVDDLATSYATTPPEDLLERVRTQLRYLSRLMDCQMALWQRRRLIVIGGWLSLLAATTHIDLRQSGAAAARLTTAAELARHAEHQEVRAWCLETQAWDALTGGDYPRAVDLSRQAQDLAPRGSSAHIQATAQEGRAWARLRDQARTREALDRVNRLTSSLALPDRPEHHYRYDPDKALSYTATTLAWAGDPAAEEYARTLLWQLEDPGNGVPRPRRVAAARLDLARGVPARDVTHFSRPSSARHGCVGFGASGGSANRMRSARPTAYLPINTRRTAALDPLSWANYYPRTMSTVAGDSLPTVSS